MFESCVVKLEKPILIGRTLFLCKKREEKRSKINYTKSKNEKLNMEWIEKLNQTINYIEEHLTEEISYDELAQIACCSTYHFQRMFTYMAGISLSEYIRRRRMSLAAKDIQNGNDKIINIGLKYGYTSPTAFNRAFQAIHGVAPSMIKKEGAMMKVYPPISFKITIKGVEEMNYRIEEKTEFRVVGISTPLDRDVENTFTIVLQMWQKAAMDGTIAQLAPLMNNQPMGLLGVSACNNDEEWKYLIAVSSLATIDETLEEYFVPASTWAIFTGTGTNQSIQGLEQKPFWIR